MYANVCDGEMWTREWKLKRYRNFPGSRLHRRNGIALITFIVYDVHIKIIFAPFEYEGCVPINNNFLRLHFCSTVQRRLNLNFYWFCLTQRGRGKKVRKNMKAKWCNDFICFQLATVIRLDHREEHAIIRRGNVLARMASLDWHVIDALEVTSRVGPTSLHALVSHHYSLDSSTLTIYISWLFPTEIPRVVNVMMTQNEAPDPPNEDPTYERYQSSEQRGKKNWFS